MGDVRVALGQAGRREHRPVSASGPLRPAERRSRARGLQRCAAFLAHAVPRHAARASCTRRRTATLELLRRISDATNCDFLEPRLALHRLAARRAAGRATRSAATSSTRPVTRPSSRRAATVRSNPTGSCMLTIQRYYAEDFAAAHEFAKLRLEVATVLRRLRNARRARVVLRAHDDGSVLERNAVAARRVRRQSLRRIRAELRRWAAAVPREPRAHAVVVRGGMRADWRRSHRSGRLLRPRDRVARAHGFVNVEALAAELAARFWYARQQAGVCSHLSRESRTRLRGVGRDRQGGGPRAKHGLKAANSATVSVTSSATTLGHGEVEPTRSTSPLCSRRARRSPARSCSSGCSSRCMDIICENAGAESGRAGARVGRRVPRAGRQDGAGRASRARGGAIALVRPLCRRAS